MIKKCRNVVKGKCRNDKGIKHNLAYCIYSQELPQSFYSVWGLLMFSKAKTTFPVRNAANSVA